MSREVAIVYHSADMDGYCGGSVIYFFESQNPDTNIHLIPHNHGQDPTPILELPEGCTTYIVDYSLPYEHMLAIKDRLDVIWIDHHYSSIKYSIEHKYDDLPGIRREYQDESKTAKASGCELAWEYFYKKLDGNVPEYSEEEFNMPYIVKMLGRYDAWDLSYEPVTFHINTYLYFNNAKLKPGPESAKNWIQLFDIKGNDDSYHEKDFERHKIINDWDFDPVKIMTNGKIMFDFQVASMAREIKAKSFEMLFDPNHNYKVIAVNGGKGSQTFMGLENKEEYDIMMVFHMDGEKSVNYGIYTERKNLDMGKLAKILAGPENGGGHKEAAGMRTKKLPWELPHMELVKKEKTNAKATSGK